MAEWLHLWSNDPATAWDGLFSASEDVRERLARLLGTEPTSVAIVDNTSRASNLAVGILRPEAGCNVVVDATTYPSSLYPWMPPVRGGVELRVAGSGRGGLAASVSDVEPLMDGRTVALTISHVDPLTGIRHELRPLADLAHAHGAVLIVDLAQSAGVLPLDLLGDGVDLAAGTAMKWLLGPPGIGYLVISRQLLARTDAPQAGYLSGELDPSDQSRLRLHRDARRHELGLPSVLGMPGFAAGLELVEEAGLPAIASLVDELVGRCLAGLDALGLRATTPSEPELRAGLVSVPSRDPVRVQAFMRERGVDIWGYEPKAMIRIDPHLFNDASDIDRCLAALDACMSTYGREVMQPR